jgi:hypothetical protein
MLINEAAFAALSDDAALCRDGLRALDPKSRVHDQRHGGAGQGKGGKTRECRCVGLDALEHRGEQGGADDHADEGKNQYGAGHSADLSGRGAPRRFGEQNAVPADRTGAERDQDRDLRDPREVRQPRGSEAEGGADLSEQRED